MAGKTIAMTAAFAAGLLAAAPAVMAHDGKIKMLYGQPPATAVAVSSSEGGTGVTVLRGSSSFVAARVQTVEAVALIDGQQVRIDTLEPATSWFIDRSRGRLVVIHCHTRPSTQVGGDRRILCDARRF